MTARNTPKRPATSEYIALCSGLRVDIFVSVEKKHCCLPKLLLCHYSPFFEICFNRHFKKSQEQKLELPEDKVNFFELLVELMLRGNVEDTSVLFPPSSPRENPDETKDISIEFIAYAEKYDLGDFAATLVQPLLELAIKKTTLSMYEMLDRSDIVTILRSAPAGHPLRGIIVRATNPFSAQDSSDVDGLYSNVKGYSAAVLKEIPKVITSWGRKQAII